MLYAPAPSPPPLPYYSFLSLNLAKVFPKTMAFSMLAWVEFAIFRFFDPDDCWWCECAKSTISPYISAVLEEIAFGGTEGLEREIVLEDIGRVTDDDPQKLFILRHGGI